MERPLDIAIVGYGIAGIAAAVHLRRSGHHITHFERNDPPVAGGAGMLLHPAAMRQLGKLEVLAAAIECGAPITRICAQTLQGRALMDFRYSDVIDGQFGLGIQRGTLHRLLSSVDSGRGQVVAGRQVISVEPGTGCLMDEDHVRHGPFDLVVIADGMHSQLRKQIAGVATGDPGANRAAVVGLLRTPRLSVDRLAQYFAGTRHLSVWPVGSAFIGDEPRCSFAVNVSMAEAESLRDEERRSVLLARLCPTLWSLVSESVDQASLRIIVYRELELTQSCLGRVAIIGDAAHSMSPQLGTGAQLALEDAAALANAIDLHTEVPGALRSFMRIRIPQLRRYHLASRWLSSLFQTDSRAMAFVRDQLFSTALNLSPAKRLAHALFS